MSRSSDLIGSGWAWPATAAFAALALAGRLRTAVVAGALTGRPRRRPVRRGWPR